MYTCHRVTRFSQIFCQIFLHLDCGFIRHRIQMLIQLRQKSNAISPDHRRGFDTLLMVFEPFFRRQSSHADIDTRLATITVRVFGTDAADFRHRRIQQHDIDIVMMLLSGSREVFSQSSTLHEKRMNQSVARPGYRDMSICLSTRNWWRVKTCSAISLSSMLKARIDLPAGCGINE